MPTLLASLELVFRAFRARELVGFHHGLELTIGSRSLEIRVDVPVICFHSYLTRFYKHKALSEKIQR